MAIKSVCIVSWTVYMTPVLTPLFCFCTLHCSSVRKEQILFVIAITKCSNWALMAIKSVFIVSWTVYMTPVLTPLFCFCTLHCSSVGEEQILLIKAITKCSNWALMAIKSVFIVSWTVFMTPVLTPLLCHGDSEHIVSCDPVHVVSWWYCSGCVMVTLNRLCLNDTEKVVSWWQRTDSLVATMKRWCHSNHEQMME